jgi:hypothetical protein
MLDHGISYIATTVGSVGVAHVATACYAMQRSCARCNSILQPRCTQCNGAVRDATCRMPRATVPRHRRHALSATRQLALSCLDCFASTPAAQYSWNCSTRSRHSELGPGGLLTRVERESYWRICTASEWVARQEWEGALISRRGLTATALQHSWLLELLTSLKELTNPKWSARHCPQPPVAHRKGVCIRVCPCVGGACVRVCVYVCV